MQVQRKYQDQVHTEVFGTQRRVPSTSTLQAVVRGVGASWSPNCNKQKYPVQVLEVSDASAGGVVWYYHSRYFMVPVNTRKAKVQ